MHLFTFAISVDPDQPAHPNCKFGVLFVSCLIKEALKMLRANSVSPNQTTYAQADLGLRWSQMP